MSPETEAYVPEDTFRVVFGCDNCGDEFEDTYPPRTEVRRSDGRVRVHDGDGATLGDFDVVRCPTCELLKHVFIDDREPLGDGDD